MEVHVARDEDLDACLDALFTVLKGRFVAAPVVKWASLLPMILQRH